MKPNCFPFHRARLSGDQRRRRGCLWFGLIRQLRIGWRIGRFRPHIDGVDLFSCPDCRANTSSFGEHLPMSHQFAKFVTGHFNQLTEAIGSPISVPTRPSSRRETLIRK